MVKLQVHIDALQTEVKQVTRFLEAFDRNVDLLQEQVGHYSLALEILKLDSKEAHTALSQSAKQGDR